MAWCQSPVICGTGCLVARARQELSPPELRRFLAGPKAVWRSGTDDSSHGPMLLCSWLQLQFDLRLRLCGVGAP
eukprot:1148387-Alexandrium_andersonii.AAC.1